MQMRRRFFGGGEITVPRSETSTPANSNLSPRVPEPPDTSVLVIGTLLRRPGSPEQGKIKMRLTWQAHLRTHILCPHVHPGAPAWCARFRRFFLAQIPS